MTIEWMGAAHFKEEGTVTVQRENDTPPGEQDIMTTVAVATERDEEAVPWVVVAQEARFLPP